MGVGLSTPASTLDNTKRKDGKKPSLRDPVVIRISQSGFCPSSVTVFSGQCIAWEWETKEPGRGHNVIQVTVEDHSHPPLPVPHGLASGRISHSDTFEVNIEASGCYQFMSEGLPHNKIGMINVQRLPPVRIKITDEGIEPRFVEVVEGGSVKWEWEKAAGNLWQMKYCSSHGGLKVKKCNFDIDTNNSCTHTEVFQNSGLYYFMGDAPNNLCIVKVVQSSRQAGQSPVTTKPSDFSKEINIRFREHKAEPSVVHAKVGDRIWLENAYPKRKDRHMFVHAEDGTTLVSTKRPGHASDKRCSPLLSYCFKLAGVYRLYCDEGDTLLQACVLVQSKIREHVIHVDQQGFKPDLGCIKRGDRVWWMWTGDNEETNGFIVEEDEHIDTCRPTNSATSSTSDCSCNRSDDLCRVLGTAGLITLRPKKPGLLTYRLKPVGDWTPPEECVCSIIVQNAKQDHIVRVSDQGFKPQIVKVHPGDCVTWLWEETSKSHNIQQACHLRRIINDGFHSNGPSPSPDAFRHVFTELGVFYFTSSAIPSLCGAVVVTAGLQVNKIEVSLHGLEPDPVGVSVGDCVCWMWCSGELYSINPITSPDEMDELARNQPVPVKRRCFAKTFTQTGINHFACTAFVEDEDEPNLHASDTFINTVLVDPLPYSSRVKVSRDGFHPSSVMVAKYQSVLWSWENALNEEHNILHVKNPQGQQQSPVRVHGSAAFDSGPVIGRSSFFHTFDTAGSYWVMSEGADGRTCRVDVLEQEKRVIPPRIAEGSDAGIVEAGFTVHLSCDDNDVTILYTLDGTSPREQLDSCEVYDWKNGIRLRQGGLYLIRAVSQKEGWIPSEVFTSRRYWVLGVDTADDTDNDDTHEGEPPEELGLRQEITNWQWLSCTPFISYGFVFENVIHIDLSLPKPAQLTWIGGFKLYLNGVVQGGWICASCPSLEVSGLTGGRTYHVIVVVFPVNENFNPQLSNELVVECSPISSFGGPVVSLETCGRVDALIIVWPAFPDTRFSVMIDGQPFVEQMVPEPDADYCRVLFESSDEGHMYTLCVVMYVEGSEEQLLSNELQFCLPLPEELVPKTPLETSDNDDNPFGEDVSGATPISESKELIIVAEVAVLNTTSSEEEPKRVLSDISFSKLETIPEDKQLDVTYTPTPVIKLSEEHVNQDSGQQEGFDVGNCLTEKGEYRLGEAENVDIQLPCSSVERTVEVVDKEEYIVESEGKEVSRDSLKKEVVVGDGVKDTDDDLNKSNRDVVDGEGNRQGDENDAEFRQDSKDDNNASNEQPVTEVNTSGMEHVDRDGITSYKENSITVTAELHEGRENQIVVVANEELTIEHGESEEENVSRGKQIEIQAVTKLLTENRDPDIHNSNTINQDDTTENERFATKAHEMNEVKNEHFEHKSNKPIPLLSVESIERSKNTTVKSSEEVTSDYENLESTLKATGLEVENKRIKVDKGIPLTASLTTEKVQTVVENGCPTREICTGIDEHEQVDLLDGDVIQFSNDLDISRPVTDTWQEYFITYNERTAIIVGGVRSVVAKDLESNNCVDVLESDRAIDMDFSDGVSSGPVNILSPDISQVVENLPSCAESTPSVQECTILAVPETEYNDDSVRHKSNHVIEGESNECEHSNAELTQYSDEQQEERETVESVEKDLAEAGKSFPQLSIVSQSRISTDVNLVVKSTTASKVVLEWECRDSNLTRAVYCLLVLGNKFGANIDSECRFSYEESPAQAIWPSNKSGLEQHSWNTRDCIIEIQGLKQRHSYRIAVLVSSMDTSLLSNVVLCTIPGRPKSPVIHITALRDQEATISWRSPCCYGEAVVIGYGVLVNGSQHGDVLPHDAVQCTIHSLQQGTCHRVSVVAVTGHSVGDSLPSSEVILVCPHPPPAPVITDIPTTTPGTVSISWLPVKSPSSNPEQQSLLSSYAVFVEDEFHGSCPAGDVTDIFMEEFVYTISACVPGREYKVYVRGHVDPQMIDSNQPKVHMCGCYGLVSNTLKVYSAGAPSPPLLNIANMDKTGVRLTWDKPREYNDVKITGYLLRVNGRVYGDTLHPECQRASLTNLALGHAVTVTLTALTGDITGEDGHEIERRTRETMDSGVESSSSVSTDRLPGAVPGLWSTRPPLILQMWGFVQSIRDVLVRQSTCCSAIVNWTVEEEEQLGSGGRPIMVKPDGYRVKWWRSEENKTNLLGTLLTSDSNVQLDDLRLPTRYAVVVEAFAKHPNDKNALDQSSGINQTRSEKIWFDIEPPADPPSNLRVVSSTNSSVCLAWDIPKATRPPVTSVYLGVCKRDYSADVLSNQSERLYLVLSPYTTTYTAKNLDPKAQYVFKLRAVTGDGSPNVEGQHCCGEESSIVAWTSGVDCPRGLHITKRTPFSLHVSWEPAATYGDLYTQHYIIHYAEKKRRWSSHGTAQLPKDSVPQGVPQCSIIGLQGEILGLEPGVAYRIVVEAVVGLREQDSDDVASEEGEGVSSVGSSESDWVADSCEDCLSEPLLASTTAPPGKPALLLTAVTATQIQLAWDAPSVLHLDPDDRDQVERLELRGRTRAIRGYTVEVNGRDVARLPASKDTYTLKRCKQGMKYTCILKATTTTAGSGGKRVNKDEIITAMSTTEIDTDDESIQGDNSYPVTISEPLEVTIPRQDHPLSVSAYYATTTSSSACSLSSRGTSSSEGEDGCIVVEWKLSASAKNMSSYRVAWVGPMEEEQEEHLSPSCTNYEIYPVNERSLYTIWVKVYREDGTSSSYGPLHCQVPGRPESPWIWCRAVSAYRILVEWNEPRTFGMVIIRAYQVNLNGRQLGKLLSPQSRKVAVHCQPSSVYRIRLLALTADPHIGGSDPSNQLTICTPDAAERSLVPKQHIQVQSLWTRNDCIAIEWDAIDDMEGADHYVVKWSSVLSPQPREKTVPMENASLVIEDCQPGTRHFIAVAAIDDRGKLVSRSAQLIVQTSAPLGQPRTRLRSSLPASIEWDQPTPMGDATVQSYEIKVNGEMHTTLHNNQLSFELPECLPCHEYSFQVRATSVKAGCDGDWTDPLVITCPGADRPVMSRVPSSRVNCIHVSWKTPELMGGATVNHYKVHYLQDQDCNVSDGEVIVNNPDTITHGPLSPSYLDDTLDDATPAVSYWVVLEATLSPEGCHAVYSQPIRTRVAVTPDPPVISVEVISLRERRTMEELVCQLTQTRDRLCRKLELLQNSVTVMGSKQKEHQITNIVSTLRILETELKNGIRDIRERTGSVSCMIQWNQAGHDDDATVTGYQVLVDGDPYGRPLDSSELQANVKLSSSPWTRVISVKSLTSHPVGPSKPSNGVPVCTKDFMPFVMFCYFRVHDKEARSSDIETCSFEDALAHEIKNHLKVKHRGALGKPLPSPVCLVMDVLTSSWKPLVDTMSDKPMAVLFWTKWCQSSLRSMEMFIQFAVNFSDEFCFTTCCVQSGEAISSHHKALKELVTDWSGHNVRHVCGCHSQSQRTLYWRQGGRGAKSEVTHMYGLVGVPTVMICNQSGYMTWKGRLCVRDYTNYQQLMCHALSGATNKPCPIPQCTQCVLEYDMDMTDFTGLTGPRDVLLHDRNITGRDRVHDIDFLHQRLHGSHLKGSPLPIQPREVLSRGTQNQIQRPTEARARSSPMSSTRSLRYRGESHIRSTEFASPPARSSIFENRFSAVLGTSLPSLRLSDELTPRSVGYRPVSSKAKTQISVEEFNP